MVYTLYAYKRQYLYKQCNFGKSYELYVPYCECTTG
jgi:hypothetical protein